jgi:hypothetical protein
MLLCFKLHDQFFLFGYFIIGKIVWLLILANIEIFLDFDLLLSAKIFQKKK